MFGIISQLPIKFTIRASGGMVDTLALGASGGNPVKVQVLSSAPSYYSDDLDIM